MKPQTTDLEQSILEAAERLFLEKGFAGTSTTDIAHAVGCNQALVHYYYRTKERLFRGIFINKINLLLDYLDKFEYNGCLMSAIGRVIDFYFALLRSNPRLPFFVMNELVLNKERREWMRETFVENEKRRRVYYSFSEIVRNEVEKGTIRPIEPLFLLLDIVSLVVMTFTTLPIYADLLEKSEQEVDTYLEERKKEIFIFVMKGLQP